MDAIIRFSLRNRALVILAALVLAIYGGWIAVNLPVDVFPDLSSPTVVVVTEVHGMTPVDLEQQVTFPIETAMNGASGVRRVRSATSMGISIIWVEFEWGMDIRVGRQIVTERLEFLSGSLPEQVESPVLAPVSSIMGEVMFIGLTSEKHTPVELRSYAETTLRRRLLAVPGVSQVTPIGGAHKQYQVTIRPEKLMLYNITLDEVLEVLRRGNRNISAGVIDQGSLEWLISAEGRYRTLEDVAATVIRSHDGVPILIRDIAQVGVGAAPMRGTATANGKRAVVLGIQKQPHANTIEVTERLDLVLDAMGKDLPEGMHLDRQIFRQVDFIQTAVSNILSALRDGTLLVVVVVFVFLANARASLITLLAIPLSLVGALMAMKWMGAGINTMTLGGMAIAIGALVDDAIIDVENVVRRLRENHSLPASKRSPVLNVVMDASIEIRRSITFATVIIVLVFVPVFFLSGVEGRLLAPLGFAYVVSLLASLIVAMTVTPVLCYFLLTGSRTVLSEKEAFVSMLCKRGYQRVLPFILRHPWGMTLPAVALFGLALVQMLSFGRTFLPEFNEGSLTIGTTTLPGTSLATSDALASRVDALLLAQPEVTSFARRTGRAEEDEHVMGVEASEFEVQIELKDRPKEEFLASLREALSAIPGMSIEVGQPISHRIDHMLSGTRAAVAVKIFGPSLYELRSLGQAVRSKMEEVPGVVDLMLEQQKDVPLFRVRFQREALARYGLDIDSVSRHLNAAVQGEKATEFIEHQGVYDLVVRLQGGEDWTLESIENLLVSIPSGGRVPLGELAVLERFTGPNRISREQVERKIVVSCNVAGRDVISVVNDCRALIEPLMDQHAGYRVEFGGQFASAIEATRVITWLSLGVVLGIGFLLHMAFGSIRDTMLVMVNLPLALIGGVAGVYFSGGVLSVASLIGFITVFGIAARNGIMLVSHIRHLQAAEGVTDFYQAVYRGSLERLSPILMTALATSLALVPLALAGGQSGKEIETPMAIVILWGLTTSMLLNMVIVPSLYYRLGRPIHSHSNHENLD